VADRGNGVAGHDVATYSRPFFSTKPNGMGLGLVILPVHSRISRRGAFREHQTQHGGATSHATTEHRTVTRRLRKKRYISVDDEEPCGVRSSIFSNRSSCMSRRSGRRRLCSRVLRPLARLHRARCQDAGMSGPELMDHLTERGCHSNNLPLGHAMFAGSTRLRGGAVDFLQKPRTSGFLECVRRALAQGRRRHEQQARRRHQRTPGDRHCSRARSAGFARGGEITKPSRAS